MGKINPGNNGCDLHTGGYSVCVCVARHLADLLDMCVEAITSLELTPLKTLHGLAMVRNQPSITMILLHCL